MSLLGGEGGAQTGYGLMSALMSGIGAYYSAKQAKKAADFDIEMAGFAMRAAEMNSRFMERQAQGILQVGDIRQGHISLEAGKVKSEQRASQAARGIQAGEGSAAEEIATTDLMKETDRYQINADATRQAWAARMGAVDALQPGVDAVNTARMRGASAQGTNPFLSGLSTFASGAGTVLSKAKVVSAEWYRRNNPPAIPTMASSSHIGGLNPTTWLNPLMSAENWLGPNAGMGLMSGQF